MTILVLLLIINNAIIAVAWRRRKARSVELLLVFEGNFCQQSLLIVGETYFDDLSEITRIKNRMQLRSGIASNNVTLSSTVPEYFYCYICRNCNPCIFLFASLTAINISFINVIIIA